MHDKMCSCLFVIVHMQNTCVFGFVLTSDFFYMRFGYCSFTVAGPIVCNSLPRLLKNVPSTPCRERFIPYSCTLYNACVVTSFGLLSCSSRLKHLPHDVNALSWTSVLCVYVFRRFQELFQVKAFDYWEYSYQ